MEARVLQIRTTTQYNLFRSIHLFLKIKTIWGFIKYVRMVFFRFRDLNNLETADPQEVITKMK